VLTITYTRHYSNISLRARLCLYSHKVNLDSDNTSNIPNLSCPIIQIKTQEEIAIQEEADLVADAAAGEQPTITDLKAKMAKSKPTKKSFEPHPVMDRSLG
jgi:hypothetical protein